MPVRRRSGMRRWISATRSAWGAAGTFLCFTRLFLTGASAARSIVGECNREDAIQNHRARFGNCCHLALTLIAALLLASLVANSPERAEAAAAQSPAQKAPEAKLELTSS